MHNKRNVIVMFLLIMLSFAIITEVSAAAEGECDGEGDDPSTISVDMIKHDIACERDGGHVQDHVDDVDDVRSFNEQKSFNKTSGNPEDNKSNENLYEHDIKNSHQFEDLKPLDNMSGCMFDGIEPADNMSDAFDGRGPVENFTFSDRPEFRNITDDKNLHDLRNGSSADAPNGEELMDDVISKLIGFSNIAPNVKKDDRNVSLNNSNQKPDGNNITDFFIGDDKKSSEMGSFEKNKKTKPLKNVKKSTKIKITKKSNKKVKNPKKFKKTNKKSVKKSKKERVKL